MRLALLILVLAGSFVLGASPIGRAGTPSDVRVPMVNLTAGGLTPLADGRAAALGPDHVLYLVTKVGAPGKRAPAGKYKIAGGQIVSVNGDGVVTDSKSWNLFASFKSVPQLYYGR